MNRLLVCALGMTLLGVASVPVRAADGPVKAQAYDSHFVRNDSGLNAPAHFLVVKDTDGFEKVFGTVPPLMNQQDRHPLPPDAFETQLVLAVIHQGRSYTDYSDVKATAAGNTLTLAYRTKVRETPETVYACPLIVSVPKQAYAQVRFVENGKPVAEVRP